MLAQGKGVRLPESVEFLIITIAIDVALRVLPRYFSGDGLAGNFRRRDSADGPSRLSQASAAAAARVSMRVPSYCKAKYWRCVDICRSVRMITRGSPARRRDQLPTAKNRCKLTRSIMRAPLISLKVYSARWRCRHRRRRFDAGRRRRSAGTGLRYQCTASPMPRLIASQLGSRRSDSAFAHPRQWRYAVSQADWMIT